MLWPSQVAPPSVLVAVRSPTAHSVPAPLAAIPPSDAVPVRCACQVEPASSLTRTWVTSPLFESSVGPTA